MKVGRRVSKVTDCCRCRSSPGRRTKDSPPRVLDLDLSGPADASKLPFPFVQLPKGGISRIQDNNREVTNPGPWCTRRIKNKRERERKLVGSTVASYQHQLAVVVLLYNNAGLETIQVWLVLPYVDASLITIVTRPTCNQAKRC